MSVTSLPKVNAQLLASQGLVGTDPYTILIVGQIGSDGTAISGDLYIDIERKEVNEILTLFGTKGELTGRILRCRENIQGRVPINVIALTADVGGTAATFSLAVTGTATADGILKLKLIDSFLYTVTIDILTGDTAVDVATAIKTKIDSLDKFPATSGIITTSTFPLTANDVGTLGNKYTIKVVDNVEGITVTEGQFSGGATDPATTGIFDNVQAKRFHAISWPWENNFTEVKNFLEPRNVISNEFLHGVAFIGFDDTEANIKTKVNGATPLNSSNLIFMGNRQVSGNSVIITPSDWRAIEFISIEALRITDGIPIASFVTVTTRRDTFGNIGLASLAYYNTPLSFTDIADPDQLFNGTEQDNLKSDGYTIVGVNKSKTVAIMGEVVSTYKFDSKGDPNVSFKFLNYIRTGFYALEVYFNSLKSTYSQSRLTEGDLVGGRAIANAESIRAEYERIYQVLSGEDFVLTQAGEEAATFYSDNLVITLDIANGVVNSSGQLPIVTQIRTINITYQLAFSTGG